MIERKDVVKLRLLMNSYKDKSDEFLKHLIDWIMLGYDPHIEDHKKIKIIFMHMDIGKDCLVLNKKNELKVIKSKKYLDSLENINLKKFYLFSNNNRIIHLIEYFIAYYLGEARLHRVIKQYCNSPKQNEYRYITDDFSKNLSYLYLHSSSLGAADKVAEELIERRLYLIHLTLKKEGVIG